MRQVVARLKAVRAVQGHRGGERSARIARSTQATASHAHDERRTAIQGPLVSYNFVRAPPDCMHIHGQFLLWTPDLPRMHAHTRHFHALATTCMHSCNSTCCPTYANLRHGFACRACIHMHGQYLLWTPDLPRMHAHTRHFHALVITCKASTCCPT